MHEYDTALKLLLQGSGGAALRELTGGADITGWLTSELPQVYTRQADLLGLTTDGRLMHIELQSTNDSNMPLRMAEYALGMYRVSGRFPHQVVFYVGEPRLRMSTVLRGPDSSDPDFAFRYRLLDVRDLSASTLLESPRIEDNVLAVLTRLRNPAETIRRVLSRIARLDDSSRRSIFDKLLIISGLRRLEQVIREEAQKMPILNDILEHQVIGPAILQGREQGRQEGIQEGRQDILRRQLERRFGAIPAWVEARLATLSAPELDDLALRLLDASTLEELLPS